MNKYTVKRTTMNKRMAKNICSACGKLFVNKGHYYHITNPMDLNEIMYNVYPPELHQLWHNWACSKECVNLFILRQI